uniref:palmdelphin-like n=1 Tax=Centroberyx gerrardi TaxID=166262 RepID=UPI003AABEB0C
MEEADLLKERLQAITDKRRVQEDIAKKRRQIEEEKLKLQYIKKKALREQWLMDGLSQQSEEEQEAMRLQAQDEQQQSDQLQSNIHRIEKEIEDLETQELNISTNEEIILKRLKEVERTAEDIIKELNAEFEAATFAMEISVEHDMRTGESQVVSTATVTPETVRDRGVKVYDDGRKSVYAVRPDGRKMHNGVVGEMTPMDVEELLRQATDKKVPSEVQYHQPVYSAPYTATSRPSTPRTPSKTPRQTPTPSPSPFQTKMLSRNGAQNLGEESQLSQELESWKTPSKTPSPGPFLQDTMPRDRAQRWGEETQQPLSHIPGQANTGKHLIPQPQSPHFGAKTPRSLTNGFMDTSSPSPAALVSITARSEGMPTPIQPVYRSVDSQSPLLASHKSGVGHDPVAPIESSVDSNRQSPFYPESEASLNLVNTLPEDLESEPITMIFMGYQNAEEDEEEEDIQAELVVIGNSDDDDEGKNGKNDNGGDEFLSYHPEGYKSKVFQPIVGVAKVAGCRDVIGEAYTNCDDLLPHKPTFIHKPGKRSPCLQGQGMDEPTSAGSINLEKMKLCSTGR